MKYCRESRTKGPSNTIGVREANWIGHSLRRNCFLKHVIKGKIEGRRRRGIRRKQLLYYCKGMIEWWKLKRKALECTVWSTPSGRDCGPIVTQTSLWWLLLLLLLSSSSSSSLCTDIDWYITAPFYHGVCPQSVMMYGFPATNPAFSIHHNAVWYFVSPDGKSHRRQYTDVVP